MRVLAKAKRRRNVKATSGSKEKNGHGGADESKEENVERRGYSRSKFDSSYLDNRKGF